MKITFSNLGAIKKTKLDLRPLTVIIGPNNSNKTYIAYSIYSIWQTCKAFSSFGSELKPFIKLFAENEDVASETEREFVLSLNDTEFINKLTGYIKRFITSRLEMFKYEISEYFQDSSRKIFSQTNFELEISEEDLLETIRKLIKRELKNESSAGMNSVMYSSLTLRDEEIVIHTKGKYLEKDLMFPHTLLFGNFIEEIINSIFKNPLLLPAERNSFVITYKMLATRRYRILREHQRHFFYKNYDNRQIDLLKEQGDIRYPQPIEGFLDFLTDVELETYVKENSKGKNGFSDLADRIESDK